MVRRNASSRGGGYDDDNSKSNSSFVKPIQPRKSWNRWLSVVKAFRYILGLLGFIVSVYLSWCLRNSGGSNIFNVEDFVVNFKNANKNRGMDRDEIIGIVREVVEKEIGTESFLTKEEFQEFVEEFKKARKQIIGYAAEIVEKEIERHAADGLGMVDYAMAGSMVVDHSQPDFVCEKNEYFWVCKIAEKMITPSFGEPGQCFPLAGDNGFVEIRLRDTIVVEAVTLEHVAKSVAFTRISAPKECRVSGWLHGPNFYGKVDDDKKFLLTEFTYDLEKKNVQTYKVVESAASKLVDTIRLDFTSNHGGSYTCIYRLRVHGHLSEHLS
ncbi:hypothetical protein ACJIZ3_015597 [Penstemon smallii]|uniref:SUN domain-containing protein n=1 Tax=Penstemon smallii TaxID=265156 RepID=A0ABD3RMY7_9LAMI